MPVGKPKIDMDGQFTDFMALVHRRLHMGRDMYGDASFHRHPDELLNEVVEELLDVVAWTFILWVRTERIRGDVNRREDRREKDKRGRKVGSKGKSVI
jgi:hypothetical protein